MKLIDKDAFVVEIKNWKQHTLKCGYAGQGEYEEGNKQGRLDTCEKFLSFIDKLEVKEVGLPNFEQEVKEFCYRFDDRKESWYNMTPHDKNIMVSPTWSNFAMQLAKHFFELGLKAQKD